MATIPIEIVLQDADSPVDPTPTPENGEDTNIVVPNTGTISNDGNNSGGISSSIGIILPIVIAILAIVTVIVLIVRKHYRHHKHFSSVMSRKEKLATVVSSTIAILAVTVLVGNLVIPATNAASDDINDVSGSSGTASEEGTYLETEDKITITAIIDKNSEEDTVTVSTKDILYATTDASGYTVTMSMVEGASSSNLYLDGDTESEYYIAPVGVNEDNTEEGTRGAVEELEGAELTTNTWGYTLNEEAEAYSPVPTVDTPATIKEGEEAVEHEEINVYYAIKVNKELPLGTYSGEIEYNMEGNYGFPKSLTTMQGMTHEICESVPTPGNKVTDPVPTATLEDTRDHKTYTIAKLADGKCWMTQNLDLDIDKNTTYTHADTDLGWSDPDHPDLNASWKPDEGHSTITFTAGEGVTVEGWVNSNTAPYSANPGNVYYYTSGNDEPDTFYDSQQACEKAHPDGSCPHYHAGNYYNWSAAVASNDTSGMTEQFSNAGSSICPAGWRLPGNATNAEDLVFNNEQDAWVSTYENIVGDLIYSGGNYYRKYQQDGFGIIRTAPLWLARSGIVINNGLLSEAGESGRYQSSTIYNNSYTYTLSPNKSGVYPVSNQWASYKTYGFSVRCVAK